MNWKLNLVEMCGFAVIVASSVGFGAGKIPLILTGSLQVIGLVLIKTANAYD